MRYPHNVISEYIRLKIFAERGKDKYGTVQIPYGGKSAIYAVEGRTIRPDGSIVELGKDAIFDRVIVKKNGSKSKAISFAMPAVEPMLRHRKARHPGSRRRLRRPCRIIRVKCLRRSYSRNGVSTWAIRVL